MRPAPILACALLLALGCRSTSTDPPSGPAEAWLPQVPDGYGRPYRAATVLRMRGRQLLFPSGETCASADACTRPLGSLGKGPLALELEGTRTMGELSFVLETLGKALGARDFACLVARDSAHRRCLRLRPFSGGQFGEWLDAEKPLGKLRVILRADGMEVVADRGKVPGPDRFGPSLPPVAGRPDFPGLDRTMGALVRRFPDEEEAVLAPSPGSTVEQVAGALARMGGPEGERLERLYLVYP